MVDDYKTKLISFKKSLKNKNIEIQTRYEIYHFRNLKDISVIWKRSENMVEHISKKEEEKFKLKQKGISGKYLIWIPELDRFTTGSSRFSNVEGIFTQSEIDDMPECYTHPAVWEKIKVERED